MSARVKRVSTILNSVLDLHFRDFLQSWIHETVRKGWCRMVEDKQRVSVSQSFFLTPKTQTRQEGDNMLAHFVLSSQAPQLFSNLFQLFGDAEDRTRAPTDKCRHFPHYFWVCAHIFENNNNWLERIYFYFKNPTKNKLKSVFFSCWRKVWLPGLAGKLSPELWTIKEWPHQRDDT